MTEALYQAEIVARARAGAADSRLEPHDARVSLDNPLCGDRTTLDLRFKADRIEAVGHRTRGCALCQASAETLRSCIPGRTRAEAAQASAAVKDWLAGGALPEALSPYAVFEPVRDYPSRHTCVLLPLDALDQALTAADTSE